MKSLKKERIASDIVKEVSLILHSEIKDEDLKNVTITYATVAPDLSQAKIYFTTLDDYKRDKVIKDINNASSFIRKLLADKIEVRHTPQLLFVYDLSIENGQKIEKILDEVMEK